MTAWEHAALLIGAVLSVLIGAGDLLTRRTLSTQADAAFILGGLSALGVKGTGGIGGSSGGK